jgi:formyltetrahydrofolate deformylase
VNNSAILLLTCPDRRGIVASISDFIFRHNGNILHADEHADEDSNIFLMRVEFDPADFDIDLADFGQHFARIAERFEMQWRLAQSRYRMKMVILVSKYDHCLVDLLYRHRSGELDVEIPLIISNHPDNQSIADFYRIPYATIPVTSVNRRDAEQKILTLVQQCNAEFLVLARYMQILSHEFVSMYPIRIINIHHSFLRRSFAGRLSNAARASELNKKRRRGSMRYSTTPFSALSYVNPDAYLLLDFLYHTASLLVSSIRSPSSTPSFAQ